MTPYNLVDGYKYFVAIYCCHLHGRIWRKTVSPKHWSCKISKSRRNLCKLSQRWKYQIPCNISSFGILKYSFPRATSRKCSQYFLPVRWFLSTRLHGAICKKTAIVILNVVRETVVLVLFGRVFIWKFAFDCTVRSFQGFPRIFELLRLANRWHARSC
jgi:hypothetical protein